MNRTRVEKVTHASEDSRSTTTEKEVSGANYSSAADATNPAQSGGVASNWASYPDPFAALKVTSPGVAVSVKDVEDYHELSLLLAFMAEQQNRSR